MKALILSGNPKTDGLCDSFIQEISRGFTDGGAEAQVLTLGELTRCHVCGTGWGTCRNENVCAHGGDGFDAAHAAVQSADIFCLVTPVYWGEMSESLKSFADRLRRCEFGTNGALSGKPALLIASAGGSGRGILTTLSQMERFIQHVGAEVFDVVAVNRWNNDYKRVCAYEAARAMASGRKAGTTL